MRNFIKNWSPVILPVILVIVAFMVIFYLDHSTRNRFYSECDPIHGHEDCRLMYMAGGHDP
jgi:hypothetical protein